MTAAPSFLYHYTCDHGRIGIGTEGRVYPSSWLPSVRPKLYRYPQDVQQMLGLCWFTDMAQPDRNALGLTMNAITCDRMQYRYVHIGTTGLVPWLKCRAAFSKRVRDSLEHAQGARPAHWWVSEGPVSVQLSVIPTGTVDCPPVGFALGDAS